MTGKLLDGPGIAYVRMQSDSSPTLHFRYLNNLCILRIASILRDMVNPCIRSNPLFLDLCCTCLGVDEEDVLLQLGSSVCSSQSCHTLHNKKRI